MRSVPEKCMIAWLNYWELTAIHGNNNVIIFIQVKLVQQQCAVINLSKSNKDLIEEYINYNFSF